MEYLEPAAVAFITAYLTFGCGFAIGRLYKHRSLVPIRPVFWLAAAMVTILAWPRYLMRR